jgi:hypothetical protein
MGTVQAAVASINNLGVGSDGGVSLPVFEESALYPMAVLCSRAV